MSQFEGRAAIVTGAAKGIGQGIARRLAAAGASVLIADIDVEAGEETAARLRSEGHLALAMRVDVRSESDIAAATQHVLDEWGRLDFMVNNAAAVNIEQMRLDDDIATLDIDVWNTAMEVNLRGAMLGCKHAINAILSTAGSGAIVNMTSVAGFGGGPSRPSYAVSKAGIMNLTKCVAAQYGKRGIRCNAIAPGFTLTPAAAHMTHEQIAAREAVHLTPRVGSPEDIAEAAAYLLDDRVSGFVTGHVMVVDGGRTAVVAGTFATT